MSSPARILVVDADADHLQLLMRSLESVGRLDSARTGEEAWAAVQAGDPDLVITDQRLPGMSGLELLNRIAERDPHIGRILLTHYGDTQVTMDAIDARRVDAYLSKPCLPHQLRLSIEAVLERARLQRDNARLFEDLITKNEQLREAVSSLRTAQKRVLDSERLSAIGRMIAMIVHDFRGPLSVMRAAGASLARGESEPAELSALAQEIGDEAERMTRMCRDLLDVTRVSGGPIAQTDEVLDELVNSALALLADDASRAGVRIETQLASNATLLLDRDRMRRVLLNLGYNAIEAMPEGGVLRVATRRTEDGILLVFADTGSGIPDEILPRLFDPFVTHGKTRGSGLGLAVVKKVIEDHGGTIRVIKPEGGGAAFRIHLPSFLGT